MNANPILLQKKYARVVELYAKENAISLEKALDVFYRSELYKLMSEGVSDMHCMSDEYLVRELEEEIKNTKYTYIYSNGSEPGGNLTVS